MNYDRLSRLALTRRAKPVRVGQRAKYRKWSRNDERLAVNQSGVDFNDILGLACSTSLNHRMRPRIADVQRGCLEAGILVILG